MVAIPPVPNRIGVDPRTGVLDRQTRFFLEALRSAVGGDAAVVAPTTQADTLAPVAVAVMPSEPLFPVALPAASGAALEPVSITGGADASLDTVAVCGCDNGELEPV